MKHKILPNHRGAGFFFGGGVTIFEKGLFLGGVSSENVQSVRGVKILRHRIDNRGLFCMSMRDR